MQNVEQGESSSGGGQGERNEENRQGERNEENRQGERNEERGQGNTNAVSLRFSIPLFANEWHNDIAFATDGVFPQSTIDEEMSIVLDRMPEYFIITNENEDEIAAADEGDFINNNDIEDEEREARQIQHEAAEREEGEISDSEGVDWRTVHGFHARFAARECDFHQSSAQQHEAMQTQVQLAKLDILRATMTLQRETAHNFVLVRVRTMIDCVWDWIYQHYRQQDALLKMPVYNRETFRLVVCSAYCLEEMKPGISWYCSAHNDRYLFATVLFAIGTSLFAQSESNIAKTLLLDVHSSSTDAISNVNPLRYDEYWLVFLRALLGEMSAALRDRTGLIAARKSAGNDVGKEEKKEEEQRKSRGGNSGNRKRDATARAICYLERAFSALIDEFYWTAIQREQTQSATAFAEIDHDRVFNESTSMISPPFAKIDKKGKRVGSDANNNMLSDLLATS